MTVRANTNMILLDSSAVKDPALSLSAKGLWAYLYALPDDVAVTIDEIAQNSADTLENVRAAYEELQNAGYPIIVLND